MNPGRRDSTLDKAVCRTEERLDTEMIKVDIHADDYALTLHTSEDILECMKAGKLDSISVVPNMSCLEECMELLCEVVPHLPFLPRMSVHLNFVEGKCLSDAKEIPLLVRQGSSLMGISWGRLFLLSYLPWKRGELKRELKREIKAQIKAVSAQVARCSDIAKEHGVMQMQKGLRIDSHQHSHMIPVVWEAVTEVIQEEGYRLEYIRNSKEPAAPFLSEVSLWKTYRPVNFVKNRLLSLYSHKVDAYYAKRHMEQMYLWGLVMSGRMDIGRIRALYHKMAQRAGKNDRSLELVFHPGRSLPQEVSAELEKDAVKSFYLSSDRRTEKEAVMELSYLKTS